MNDLFIRFDGNGNPIEYAYEADGNLDVSDLGKVVGGDLKHTGVVGAVPYIAGGKAEYPFPQNLDDIGKKIAQRRRDAVSLYITETHAGADELQTTLDRFNIEAVAASAGGFGYISNWKHWNFQCLFPKVQTVYFIAKADALTEMKKVNVDTSTRVIYVESDVLAFDSKEEFDRIIKGGERSRSVILREAEQKRREKEIEKQQLRARNSLMMEFEWIPYGEKTPISIKTICEAVVVQYKKPGFVPETCATTSISGWLGKKSWVKTPQGDDFYPTMSSNIVGPIHSGKSGLFNCTTAPILEYHLKEVENYDLKERIQYICPVRSAEGLVNVVHDRLEIARARGIKTPNGLLVCSAEAQAMISVGSESNARYMAGQFKTYSNLMENELAGGERADGTGKTVRYPVAFLGGIQPDLVDCFEYKRIAGQGGAQRPTWAWIPRTPQADNTDINMEEIKEKCGYNRIFEELHEIDVIGVHSFSADAWALLKEYGKELEETAAQLESEGRDADAGAVLRTKETVIRCSVLYHDVNAIDQGILEELPKDSTKRIICAETMEAAIDFGRRRNKSYLQVRRLLRAYKSREPETKSEMTYAGKKMLEIIKREGSCGKRELRAEVKSYQSPEKQAALEQELLDTGEVFIDTSGRGKKFIYVGLKVEPNNTLDEELVDEQNEN